MARAIEKGATYLDKLCHKIYDEPKGCGFQVDGECIRCGGPLLDYYCEERLHLIVCKKCGTLALTKACAPQVAANLTLSRKPTLTPPNEWVRVEDELPARDGVYLVFTMRGSVTTAHFYAEKTFSDGHRRSANWQGNRKVTHWMPLPEPPDRRPPEGEEDT